MKINIACAIFDNIESDVFSDMKKGEAIRDILQMPTHNSITKESMLNVTAWLWNQLYEWEDEVE